jgi:ribosomal protein S18 acetylase RimI-like enzyme
LLADKWVFGMQMGTDNELKGKQGKFQCFVAYDLNADSGVNSRIQNIHTPGADVPFFFKFLLTEHLRVRDAMSTTGPANALRASLRPHNACLCVCRVRSASLPCGDWKASWLEARDVVVAWLQAGFEVSPASIGLLGAVVVDMQGTFLPAERVEKGPFVAYERPQDVAYISNLTVIPQARRQGVGEQLLLAAENVRCLAPASALLALTAAAFCPCVL